MRASRHAAPASAHFWNTIINVMSTLPVSFSAALLAFVLLISRPGARASPFPPPEEQPPPAGIELPPPALLLSAIPLNIVLPESAQVDGFIGHPQILALSCESRSAVDWASFFGVHIGEI